MANSKYLRGIIPVLNTPLKKDQAIDEDGLKRLVEFLISKKVGGFWALGTSSEDMTLSFSRRIEVARIVAETNAGRIPLLLGASFYPLEDILEFIKETHQLEIDAFHVIPYHPLISLDRLEWFYRHIADNCPKPLWMYSSANYGRSVTPEFVAKVKDHPNITGIKFSTTNAVDIAKMVMLADDNFEVITAIAGMIYTCLCLGIKAHTTSIASCLPEMLINIYNLFQSDKRAKAFAEQKRLIRILNELPKGPHKDNFFQAAEEKYILSLRGICNEYVTSYYRVMNKGEKEKVKALIKKYKIPI